MKKLKKHVRQFNSNLKNTTKTAIIAAAGLISASTWKDVMTEWLAQINSIDLLQGKLIIAIIITFMSAIVVFIAAKALK
jgi:hypothetical protein